MEELNVECDRMAKDKLSQLARMQLHSYELPLQHSRMDAVV